MEFDRDLYQKAFSRITLSDKKREEILHMSEQKEKRRKPIGRRMLVAAVTALLAAVLAMGANAATDGELGRQFVKLVDSVTTQNGVEVNVYEGTTEDGDKRLIITDLEVLDVPIRADSSPSAEKEGHIYARYEFSVDDDGTVTVKNYQKYDENGKPIDDGTTEVNNYTTPTAQVTEVEEDGSKTTIKFSAPKDNTTCEYSKDEETDTVTATAIKTFYYTVADSPAEAEETEE